MSGILADVTNQPLAQLSMRAALHDGAALSHRLLSKGWLDGVRLFVTLPDDANINAIKNFKWDRVANSVAGKIDPEAMVIEFICAAVAHRTRSGVIAESLLNAADGRRMRANPRLLPEERDMLLTRGDKLYYHLPGPIEPEKLRSLLKLAEMGVNDHGFAYILQPHDSELRFQEKDELETSDVAVTALADAVVIAYLEVFDGGGYMIADGRRR